MTKKRIEVRTLRIPLFCVFTLRARAAQIYPHCSDQPVGLNRGNGSWLKFELSFTGSIVRSYKNKRGWNAIADHGHRYLSEAVRQEGRPSLNLE